MGIKLIAFDLDGTFLDDKKNCIKENMEAISAAAERGVHIVPSTGRMFTGIYPLSATGSRSTVLRCTTAERTG